MSSFNVTSAANTTSETRSIEEISIIIAAQDLTPSMLSQDFLKFSGIIPKEWKFSQQPIQKPNFAQLSFSNGVGLTAQPRTISISESLGSKELSELAVATVASQYIHKLPHAEYMGLSISPKILIPFPNAPQTVRQYISGNLLGSGAWKKIGRVPVQAGINLMYLLDRCQLTINISEARLQQPQKQPIIAILFAGSFNYSVNVGKNQENKAIQITNFLNNWKTDLEEFREIVHQKFLESDNGEFGQSIGETSLFPGQTL
ncbi:hypothetical protein [Pleurocapsa sp. PCC 7319]|uniref:hypothetical protein n=1 Tax=Pleurocapsa sp. PCC 7319 TaxID=118161 RepID=UPI00037E5AC2|nr:hypothetical protein [Pleurocapsa sp. PCC 7319]